MFLLSLQLAVVAVNQESSRGLDLLSCDPPVDAIVCRRRSSGITYCSVVADKLWEHAHACQRHAASGVCCCLSASSQSLVVCFCLINSTV